MKRFNIAYLIIIGIILSVAGFIIYNFYIIPAQTEYNPIIESTSIIKKKHNVNDYTVVSVDERQMVSLYFNDFISEVYTDLNSSYNLINLDYQNAKFENFNAYKEYIETITSNFTEYPSIESYRAYVTKETKSKVYQVEDTKGNEYYFRVAAVMDYDVYFDEETITIE